MRSRIQHSRLQQSWLQWFVAACAACSVGVVACSDEDPETEVDPLQGASGNAGSSSNAGAAGSAGSGGASTGGQGGSSGGAAAGSGAGGAAAGSSAGGSANAAGAAGTAGAAGAAGSGPDVGEPDAGGGEEPGDDQISFAADLYEQIFLPRCGGCHGTEWGSANLQGVAYPAAAANAEEIAGRVDGSEGDIMPRFCGAGPGQGTCLSVEQVADIQAWAEGGALP